MTIRSQGPRPIRVGGRKKQLGPLHWALLISVGLNVVLLATRGGGDESPSEATPEAVTELDDPIGMPTPEEPTDGATGEAASDDDDSAPGMVAMAEGEAPAKFAKITINGPVSRGFVKAVGSPEGDRLALTVSRILVWNLNLTKDPRPGDVVEVLYRVNPEDEVDIDVLAVRYESEKFGKTFESWQYAPEGWKYPGWFDADGREVAAFLTDGPIKDYQQITSLIGDGRGHSGMDFKAPVGTELFAPFDGTVTRTNWKWKYNGNCVELRGSDGRTAKMLHLSGLADGIKPGSKVKAGDPIAMSGNTGRSFAPHLHYELSSSSGRTLDPVDEHTTKHRLLGGADKAGFATAVAELARRMDGPGSGE
ncbi:MAG: M23 family metallopeptidase [Proteobacteria bacterium]|nr:M23 family metallopeptidase [Pseudomonadota bacterium]